jgi:hypothetical protein
VVRRPLGIAVPAGAALVVTHEILLEDFALGLKLAEGLAVLQRKMEFRA